MIENVKKITQLNSLPNIGYNYFPKLKPSDVSEARKYIKEYWQNLERFQPINDDSLLGLPYPYLVPSCEKVDDFDFNEMYYWDSYFMVQGILDVSHKKLVLGTLDNLIYLQKNYGLIPNASRMYLTGRSQPPLLTSFIFDVYKAYNMSDNWLESHIVVAKNEYENVWMCTCKPHNRKVFEGLSRYYDINMLHDLAEAESGWDMTSRFNRRALDYIPIDLNCLLYKYESDFAKTAKIIGDEADEKHWHSIAKKRAKKIDEYLWSPTRKQYFDFNYKNKKRSSVASLAGFYTLWAGLVSEDRADILVKKLRKFEHKGGLATTDTPLFGKLSKEAMPLQWAYPNGWAPLHYLIINGLEKYGYHLDAKRIAMKWLKTNNEWFKRKGIFLEKYNVVDPRKPPLKGVYPTQIGFGWTNAIFEKLCRIYIDE